MNQTEKIGWIVMSLGLFTMSLPFIIPKLFNLPFIGNDKAFMVAIPALIIFLLGAAKTLPEVLIATFGCKDSLCNDGSQKESTKE